MRQPVPFGKYLLLDRISVGGMAEVFKAKSYGVEGFEKIIAIKRILPTMGEDRDFIKMFIDEAKIAGQLAHANICQIFELGRIDGSHFIAMEYIWGKDLLQIQNRLRKIKQPMPIAMACFTIAKVLEGLDYAHRKRDPLGRPLEIVHRDCSPQNVLVSYEGEVKVIDFGIAKATSRNSRTMAGVLKGKFGYMSPEQVRGLPLDRRSDIFALGTMLYECLTGDRLFQGETDFSTLEKVRNVDIRPPRELNPNIPQDVEAVILKALAKDVEERYQWCSEMLADLQAFLMGQDVVFTAKSLSSWLKEVFSTEIDRERQQLEHYKRVGRDGLISGVPAAEHKGDVIEGLGEAGPAEGDPTVLGGPSFDDVEQPSSAPAEVGPAPGSPAAVGTAAEPPSDDDDDSEAFGEEAPTEIFGEINHGANPALPMPGSRAPTASQSPLTRPPKPPPSGRPPTSRGDASSPVAAMPQLYGPGTAPVAPRTGPGAPTFVPVPSSAPQPAMEAQGFPPPYQPYAQPPGYPMQPAQGDVPGTPPAGLNGMQPPSTAAPGHGRTLLGTNPPAGTSAYSQGGPYAPYPGPPMPHGGHGQGQGPMQGQDMMPPTQGSPMHGYPQAQGHYPQAQGQYPQAQQQPQYPQAQGHYPQAQAQPQYPQAQYHQPQGQGPSGPWQPNPYDSNPYAAPSGPYGQPPYNQGAPPVEQAAPSDSKRRSSIARDVAIGVAIAAAVLGGFLIVKFLLLDDSSSDAAAPISSPATIRLAMTPGVSADLFVDDKKIATVSDKQEIPVSAGQRKVKLVGPTGARCEQPMNLPAGKTTTLECAMTAGPSPAPGPSGGSAGSATPGASDTAPGAAGSGSSAANAAGSGSSEPQPPGAAADRVVPDKTDKMPAEETRPGKSADKPADLPADKSDKPADQTGEAPRPAAATTDKGQSHTSPKPVEKPGKPSDVDDDLGRLQGGTKPGERRPSEARKSAADDAPRGYLAVTSKSPARIAVDGVDTGLSTPITGHMLPLPAGKHKVTFTVGGDRVVTFPVVIKAGENTALHKDL